MEKNWTDGVRNEEVSHGVKEEENILQIIVKKGKLIGLVTSCVGTTF
jgi:hypothetical protein